MGELIRVGMADMNICRAPDRITTLGLGSCIGLVLFDISHAVCGMIHIMLPDSSISKVRDNPAKFADTGIPELVNRLEKMGASRSRMVAKIAGGAKMFAFQSNNQTMRVGDRNVQATLKKLKELNIKVLAQDTGDSYGRTVIFYPENGNFIIRAVGKPEKVI